MIANIVIILSLAAFLIGLQLLGVYLIRKAVSGRSTKFLKLAIIAWFVGGSLIITIPVIVTLLSMLSVPTIFDSGPLPPGYHAIDRNPFNAICCGPGFEAILLLILGFLFIRQSILYLSQLPKDLSIRLKSVSCLAIGMACLALGAWRIGMLFQFLFGYGLPPDYVALPGFIPERFIPLVGKSQISFYLVAVATLTFAFCDQLYKVHRGKQSWRQSVIVIVGWFLSLLIIWCLSEMLRSHPG